MSYGLRTTLKNAKFAWDLIKGVGENIDLNWAKGATSVSDLIDKANRAKGAAVLKTINPKSKLSKSAGKVKVTGNTSSTKSTTPVTLDPSIFGDMTIELIRANLEDLSKTLTDSPYTKYNNSMSDEDSVNLFKLYLDELNAKLNLIPLNPLLQTVVQETPVLLNPTINLTKTDTDAILSHYGYKPNSVWSEALQKYLAGDKNLNMSWANDNLRKEWMTPGYGSFTVFKKEKGGRLVSKNPVKRFLEGGKGIFSLIMNQVKSITKPLQKKSENVSGSTDPIRKLLKQLFDIKAFGDISEKKAVDGLMGPRTKAAIKKAQEMGYEVNGEGIRKPGYWEKVITSLYSATNPDDQQKVIVQNGSESPFTSENAIKLMKLTRDLNSNMGEITTKEEKRKSPSIKTKLQLVDAVKLSASATALLIPTHTQMDFSNYGSFGFGGGVLNNPTTNYITHYSTNNPFLTAFSDLLVSTGNRIYRKASGKGPEDFIFKNPDIYYISDGQKQVLIDFYKDKWKKTGKRPTGWTSGDWRLYQGTYTGGNRNLFERVLTTNPYAALEHSLGQWNYMTDKDGNVIAYDTYDWNDGETSANQGYYTSARDFMGRNGTKLSETIALRKKHGRTAARTMKVNLGKIDSYD